MEEFMQSKIGHLQVNVDPKNQSFYKGLFDFLGWSVLYQDENMIGVGDANGCGLWFVPGLKQISNDYDGVGTNHIAISVSKQSDVDQTVEYMKAHGIEALFETPRHRPDFSSGPEETYYQVMFTSPDNLLFEVVYTGPISK
jgi:catechol 2,3-dioxygenase-like lactoylglutathione lyase family enzyme